MNKTLLLLLFFSTIIYATPTTPTTSSVTQPDCYITSGKIIFTTQSGVEYSVDNGGNFQASATFSGLVPGVYTLVVRDLSDSTTATAASTVTINAVPTPPTIPYAESIIQPSCAQPYGTVVINAQPGVEYSIDNGTTYQASRSFVGLAPGTYWVVVRNINNTTCQTNAANTIVINPAIGPTAIATTIVKANCGIADGSVSLGSVTGGDTPYTYNFNNAGFSGTLTYTNLLAGSYPLVVKDFSGCVLTTTVEISNTTGPTAIATSITNGCGSYNGSVTITGVTGGVAPYTYSFLNSTSGGTGPYTATSSYINVYPGCYIVSVKDANGCFYNTSICINNSPGPTSFLDTIVNASCGIADGSITLGAVTGGVAPYTYSFNTAFGAGPYTTATVYSGLAVGSYKVEVKDANGCRFGKILSVINVNGPTAIATTKTNPTCANVNGSISIDAVTGGVGPYTYNFNNTGFLTTTVYTGLAIGCYSIYVKDVNGCVYNSPDICLIYNSSFTVPTAVVTQPSCGTPTGTIVFNAQSGAEYSVNNGSNYQLSPTFSSLGPGTYTLKIRSIADSTCVESAANTISISVAPPKLSLAIIGVYDDYNADGFVSIGDVINYQITVSNCGAYPITNISINSTSSTIYGAVIASLAVGGVNSTNFTGRHIITQNDINNGSVYGQISGVGTYQGTTISGYASANNFLNISDGIRLIAFVDTNNNGIKDGGEQFFENGRFSYELNNNGVIHNLYINSIAAIYENNPSNSYDLNYVFNSDIASYCTANPAAYSNITVAAGSGLTTYYFPITTSPYTDLRVYIGPQNEGPRPGFTYKNYIYITNKGSQTTPAGTLTFTNDSRVTITNVSPSVSMTATGFTYNYPILAPNQNLYLYVTMQVPTIPTVNLGDLLVNTASISIPPGDINVPNNTSSISQVIVGSYDPNDKMEAHGPKIVHSTFTSNDYLDYTIQFENTGTANAVTVKVNDLLDSKLDETSIKMINASHNYTLDRVGNDLTWHFDGIDLPPSVAGTSVGKGFINFQVKPKTGYAVGDIINNTAYIYFDFNPAIITNTFATEFVTTLAVTGFENEKFSAYPNPTNGIITIVLKNSSTNIDRIAIIDILGKTVQVNNLNNSNATIDLSGLSKGLYFVKIQTEGQVNTFKVIKE